MPTAGQITRRGVCVSALAILLICALRSVPTLAQAPPKKLALLVGVNVYLKRGLAEKPLKFAERDVAELAQVLTDQGFKVVTLKGNQATKKAIETARDRLIEECNANDLVLLGFAGHGVQLELRDAQGKLENGPNGKALSDAYFCPVDAVQNDGKTMISLIRLFETLDQRGGINMVMADCCRDNPEEAAKRGVRSFSGNELVGRLPKNSGILLSCAADQQAREHEKAGNGHGVFFHQVIEGLKGRAVNQNGDVSWNSLAEFVQENVNAKAIELFPNEPLGPDGSLQTPHALNNFVRRPILAHVVPNIRPTGFAETVGMRFVKVPRGSFEMGTTDAQIELILKLFSDVKREDIADEQPAHRVEISAFELSAFEITVSQFRKFVNETGYQTDAERDGKGGYGFDQADNNFKQDAKYTWRNAGFPQTDEHPVVNVSYNDAVAFCDWLSGKRDGRVYRLPTEAEWEYACRGGSDSLYSNGDEPDALATIGNVADASAKAKFANWKTIAGNDGYVFTSPVGRFQPNKYGVFDMTGNVWEWCLDYYDKDYYKGSPSSDPHGPAKATLRVSRGGGWRGNGRFCRSASRSRSTPEFRNYNLGFRVARVSPR